MQIPLMSKKNRLCITLPTWLPSGMFVVNAVDEMEHISYHLQTQTWFVGSGAFLLGLCVVRAKLTLSLHSSWE